MPKFQPLRRSARLRAALAVLVGVCVAGVVAWPPPARAQPHSSSVAGPLIAVDWQDPQALPPQFRNHCRYDSLRGRWYCSNHCGIDYQFYFCSRASFGCCRLGRGYCDRRGHLRCAP
jgi:hypothetical protein